MNNTTLLETLWNEHRVELSGYVANRINDYETIKDLISSVYLRAWVAICHGNGPNENARAWLYQIARSVLNDHWRALHYQSFVSWDDFITASSEDITVFEQVLNTISGEQIECAIKRLKDSQRACLYLFLAGYDQNEIGVILGKSVGAIRQINVRARRHLQEWLKETA